MTERYLGDGLYASFDGYMIKLRAPRADGDHIVFLEPAIWHELVCFHNDCVGGKVEVSND